MSKSALVLPLALGALVLRGSPDTADLFVLELPVEARQRALSWAVFLGGFSAGLGMIAAETTALAIMISSAVVAPAAEAWAAVRPLRRHIVRTRWVAAALVLVAAFAYERKFGTGSTLVEIGFISFAAVMQLAPALVGGLVWRGASRAGALAGMAAGFAVWAYTVVVPVLARSGWLPGSILDQGPFGIEALALAWLAGNTDKLPAGVHEVPADIDAEAAGLVLATTGTSIDALTPAQLAYRESWRIGS